MRTLFTVCLTVSGIHSPVFAINGSFRTSGNSLQKQAVVQPLSDTLTIKYDEGGRNPIFISGKVVTNPSQSLNKTNAAAQNRAICRSYLSQISHALRIAHTQEELTIIDVEETASSETAHYRIRQHFRGIPVLGAEATLHLHGDRAEFIGHTVPTPDLSVVPALSAAQAVERAVSGIRASGVVLQELSIDEQVILEYSKPSVELVVFPSDATDRLAYQVLVRPNMIDWWECIVDAETGDILLKYNRTCDAGEATAYARDQSGTERLIHTYQTDKYYLIDASRFMFNASQSHIPNKLSGAIVTYDYHNRYPATSSFNLISSNNNTWDPEAVSAQYNASIAYEYYLTTHGRNSIDGKGGTIMSFVNVADFDGGGMDNAYWNGRGMFYGNGRIVFKPLASALDVAGHEMTHGVVDATAALRYIGQSGALNESFADIFGCMIERNNWTVGETVLRSGQYPSGALRDMSNPHNGAARNNPGWQPQSMTEYQKLPNTTAGDNGGVHVNMSIPSYAYYLFATAVGKEKAERVYYLTLTNYLSASSQFADMRIATRLACEELYGKDSPEGTALAAAFDRVGILDNTQPFDHVANIPVNPGKEYVLLTAAPPGNDGTTIYIADSAFGLLKGVSKRPVLFRPSISDDGKKVLFVSKDKQLIALTLNGTTATESVIDASKIWSRCAISRDGLRYAAVRDEADTAIYIGSMSGGPVQKFNLNGPIDGVYHAVTGAVISTALEWNFNGDDVIYDVFNSLSGPNGTTLENWDIGFLRAWDHASNTMGDGAVSKLFNNLGDGISVGNPTFSKNSPNIIAYESVDDLTNSISIMTMNMENRKTTTVALTAFPGYPSYSRHDDKIAYSTIDRGDTVVSVVKVKEDKQTVDGNSAIAIRKMKWAIYYADGNRELTPTAMQSKIATRTAPAPKLGLMILSCKDGLKATITGAGNAAVRISIVRADGSIVHRETLFAGIGPASYSWNGGSGGPRARGLYFMRVETPWEIVAKKFVLF